MKTINDNVYSLVAWENLEEPYGYITNPLVIDKDYLDYLEDILEMYKKNEKVLTAIGAVMETL